MLQYSICHCIPFRSSVSCSGNTEAFEASIHFFSTPLFSFFFFPNHPASDSHTLYILILKFSVSLATQLFFPLISSLAFFYRKRAALGAGLRVAVVMALCFIG